MRGGAHFERRRNRNVCVCVCTWRIFFASAYRRRPIFKTSQNIITGVTLDILTYAFCEKKDYFRRIKKKNARILKILFR